MFVMESKRFGQVLKAPDKQKEQRNIMFYKYASMLQCKRGSGVGLGTNQARQ